MAPKQKVTDGQAAEIRARKEADPALTITALAAEYGVNVSTISRIVAAKASPSEALDSAAHSALYPSPLNPRKSFDPDTLQDLAASIATDGVLLPLLVRHANQDGNRALAGAAAEDFEIIAGERRWRAVAMLIERGEVDGSYRLPVRVINPCDDRKLLELALTENIARRDMTPIEEAEAFAQLVEQGATPLEIGNIVGLTARTVQKRLRLVRDLTPQVREALANGTISVEAANVLAAYCPKSKQNGTVEEMRQGYFQTTNQLKNSILRTRIPESAALFESSLYKGEWIEDDDKPGIRYFADSAAFKVLQDKGIEKKLIELNATYSWVEVFDGTKGKHFQRWDYAIEPGHLKAGAAIVIDERGEGKVVVDLVRQRDLVPAATVNSASAAPTPAETEPSTRAHNAYAHARKTAAMQSVVAADSHMAMKLVCLALLGSHSVVKIDPMPIDNNNLTRSPVVDAFLEKLIPDLSEGAGTTLNFGQRGFYASSWNINAAGTWQAIDALEERQLHRLFSSLVALRVGTFSDFSPSLGDNSAALAVASSLGLVGKETETDLRIKPEDLEGLRRDTLLDIAKAASVEGDLKTMKVGELKTYIAQMADRDFVVPSLRFGEAKDVTEWMRRPTAAARSKISCEDQQPEQVARDVGEPVGKTRESKFTNCCRSWRESFARKPPVHFIEVRMALTQAINALLGRGTDPIDNSARFDPEELYVNPLQLIADVFDMDVGDPGDLDVIPDFGAAIQFVCQALEIPFEEIDEETTEEAAE